MNECRKGGPSQARGKDKGLPGSTSFRGLETLWGQVPGLPGLPGLDEAP